MGACGLGVAGQGQVQLLAILADPANMPCRHAHHQRVFRYVPGDDGTGTNEGKFANGHAADDGAVGTQSGALFDQGFSVFALAFNEGARVVHVGKHHAGAAEHTLFQRHFVINADVVLYLAAVANDHLVADKHVLAKRHALANAGTRTHVHKVPDA